MWRGNPQRNQETYANYTGFLYFTKVEYDLYSMVKVQNIASTQTDIYLSSMRKVRKKRIRRESTLKLCSQLRLKQGKWANILDFYI